MQLFNLEMSLCETRYWSRLRRPLRGLLNFHGNNLHVFHHCLCVCEWVCVRVSNRAQMHQSELHTFPDAFFATLSTLPGCTCKSITQHTTSCVKLITLHASQTLQSTVFNAVCRLLKMKCYENPFHWCHIGCGSIKCGNYQHSEEHVVSIFKVRQ
jgi:hypothetical protein